MVASLQNESLRVSCGKIVVQWPVERSMERGGTAMDFFDNPYHKLNKRLLSFLGHWPHQSAKKKRLHRVLIISWILSILIPEIIKLTDVWSDDLDTVFECVPPLGLHAINLLKWISLIVNNDKMKKLLIIMEADWKSRENGNGSVILWKYAERGRILTVGYSYYMFISACLYLCLPLIPILLDVIAPLNASRPIEPLFHAEYFVDQDKFFVPVFLHAVLTTFTSVTIIVSFDTMYGAYTQYAGALFAELGEQLEKCESNKDESLDVSKDQDYTYHHIVKFVKKHKEAIEFCNLMESAYTGYFLFVTGTSVILMSFTGLQTVMRLDDPKAVLRYGSYTLGQIVHVFFGCWHGQLLIDHSLNINGAIYNSKWYKSSFRSRRLLLIVMMRSINACQLSAGKLFFMSSETFSTIIKSAMSYFTVLKSLR